MSSAALEFDQVDILFSAESGRKREAAIKSALQRLDRMFEQMSESEVRHASVATELREHPRWQEVRDLARCALETFGWSCDVPPKERFVYVRGRDG